MVKTSQVSDPKQSIMHNHTGCVEDSRTKDDINFWTKRPKFRPRSNQKWSIILGVLKIVEPKTTEIFGQNIPCFRPETIGNTLSYSAH